MRTTSNYLPLLVNARYFKTATRIELQPVIPGTGECDYYEEGKVWIPTIRYNETCTLPSL